MCQQCGKTSACNCSQKATCKELTEDIQYNGTNFTCVEDESISITSGMGLSAILLFIYQKLCSLATSVLALESSVTSIVEAHVIEDEGVPLTQRGILNFVGSAVVVTDGGGKTIVTINAGTGSVGPEGQAYRQGLGVPSGALGVDGDTYIDLGSADIDVYTKAAGVWTDTTKNLKGLPGANGSNGANGANGTDGANGLNFIQGSGAPSILLGVDGDSYYDNLTGDIYIKSLGSWGITSNIFLSSLPLSYGFMANKITQQTINNSATNRLVVFEDDLNLPYFDNGNDMYVDKYIVPIAGIKQKFILENLTIENTGFNPSSALGIDLSIRVNGVPSVTFSIPSILNGGTLYVPSIVTSYLTLNVGDVVDVYLDTYSATGQELSFNANTRFSNSFEL